MNPLLDLRRLGQGIWLDDLSRDLLRGGELARLVAEDGLSGVTSNPSIFRKAIAGGEHYRLDLDDLRGRIREPEARYEALAVSDVQAACDLFRPVYERTRGDDGYASLEVSPKLASDEEATFAAAIRLHEAVGRDNVLIKVPGTDAGLRAFERLIARGIGVNVTLLFSGSQVARFAQAYADGLRRWIGEGGDPRKVKSVASLFLSRVDVLVDARLDRLGGDALRLRGRTAIDTAKLAYAEYKRRFHGPSFADLAVRGARPQYLLWASTGTKDARYSDVHYVEPLIGPETINTMPRPTLAAFRDHGTAALTLERELDAARDHFAALAGFGIDAEAVAATLQEDGIRLFREAYDALLAAVR